MPNNQLHPLFSLLLIRIKLSSFAVLLHNFCITGIFQIIELLDMVYLSPSTSSNTLTSGLRLWHVQLYYVHAVSCTACMMILEHLVKMKYSILMDVMDYE